jgi:hypothetical protein
MLEEKMERTMVGETLVINKEVDFLKLEEAIVEAKHEIIVLEEEEKSIHKQLESMKKVSGFSFWPKPIGHPSVHEISENSMYINWLTIVDFTFEIFIMVMLPLLFANILPIHFVWENFWGTKTYALYVGKFCI